MQVAASASEETSAAESIEPTAQAAVDSERKTRIKIGTQRPGAPVPRVEPRTKVAFHAQPTEVKSAEAKSVASTTSEDRSAQSLAEPGNQKEQGRATDSQTTAQPAYTLQPKPSKPRFQIPAAPASKIEVPNLRQDLSPELEAELQEALGNQSLDEMIEAKATGAAASEALEPDTRLQGTVSRIFRDNVFVDLGGRNQGVLALHSFAKEPVPGAMLEVVVTKFNPEEGLYELAAPGASVDVGDWSDLAEGIIVEAQITGHNKGGLECEVNKIRGFIPAGQISLYRVENFEEFVGQRWSCVVTEANAQRRNLVLSRRAVLEREQAEAKQQLLSQLAVGDVREGTVRTIRDFGAFVDLGGIDGLIHVSQMSWDRVKHPSDVLAVGQKVKVKIQKIDPETHKISLAYRDLFESPWTNVSAKYPVTSRVTGKVSKIMDFGAFVKLEPGVEGLVHISELSHKRVFRPSEVVQEGQEVEAKVLSVDPENQRISLSMKALEARPEPTKKDKAASDGSTGSSSSAEEASPLPKKQRKVPLKGGLGKSAFGEKFGLKW